MTTSASNGLLKALIGLAIALLVMFLITPILVAASVSWTADESLSFPPTGFSLRWYREIFTDPVWRRSLINSAAAGSLCAALATATGTAAAYGISRIERRGAREALLIVFILPLAVPHMSLAMAFYPVFAKAGLIGTVFGIALGQALFGFPFVVLSVISVIRRRDHDLERAARTLGANSFQSFRYVMLPLLKPGIVVGAILSFMTSFDDVTVPIFLSGVSAGTLPKAMLDGLALNGDPSVMAASTSIAVFGLALFALSSAFTRRRNDIAA